MALFEHAIWPIRDKKKIKVKVADLLFEAIIELQRRQGRLSIFRRFNPASRPGIAIDSQSLCSTAVMGANYTVQLVVCVHCTPQKYAQQNSLACKFNKSIYSNISIQLFTIINFELRMR